MYRVNIGDDTNFSNLLKINDVEYVDAIIDNNKATFISNTKEVFAILSLDSVAVDEDTALSIRIPRGILISLLCKGYILIGATEELVSLQFFEIQETGETELSCSVKFPRQDIWTGSYLDKLEMLTKIETKDNFDLKEIQDIIKIGSSVKSVIDCNCNLASISLNSTCKIIKKLSIPADFSMSAYTLNTLLKVSNIVFNYRNYIGAVKDNLTVLCTKCRGSSNETLKLLEEEKASFIANIDLYYLQRFLSKIKINCPTVKVNLESRSSELESGSKKFSVPVVVKDLQKSPLCEECSFVIDKNLLELMNKIIHNNLLHIANKKTFVQLDMNDITIIFRS